MPSKLSTPAEGTQDWVDVIEDIAGPQRLVRHITSLQVKNFTPFPARDSLASALTQPAERPSHTADDLDLGRGLGRTRRVSSSSISSLSQIAEGRGRRRTLSRASNIDSLAAGSILSTSPPVSNDISADSHGVARRPSLAGAFQRRPRANSSMSVLSQSSGQTHNSIPASGHGAGIWMDHNQATLERILRARLVETFVALSVPSPESAPESARDHPHSAASVSPVSPNPASPVSPRRTPGHKPTISISASGSGSSRLSKDSGTCSSSPHSSRFPKAAGRDRLELDNLFDGDSISQPSLVSFATAPSFPSSFPSTSSHIHTSSTRTSRMSFPAASSPKHSRPIPDYISPSHHPSTNPAFSVDFTRSLPPWTDTTSERATVELWAKVVTPPASLRGKGKQKEEIREDGEGEWRLLEEWVLNLADLIPLPEEYIQNPARIPFNTLIFTLLTSSHPLYLPPPDIDPTRARARSVSPTRHEDSERPTAPLTSDGLRNLRVDASANSGESSSRGASTIRQEPTSARIQPRARTSNWPELLKLATLQTALAETRAQLRDTSTALDDFVASDESIPLKREVSERQARVDEWRGVSARMHSEVEDLRQRISEKRMALRERREEVDTASGLLADDAKAIEDTAAEIAVERERNAALRARIAPRRAALVAMLAWLFPIELRSPPDLLFTILDIPLAIPAGATDPAPPLTLAAHKDVNEDTVASALGYAALVVGLLAAYTGISLVYPVTFIGSKSVIRDGISAMVGPRMFPLFSRGVDTYRFEYGVFLLNKDIELLMAERDLRALDVRHTLANLKNLLLTLSDGVAPPTTFTPSLSSVSSIGATLASDESDSGLASSSASPTPTERSLATVKDGGSTTPTQTSTADPEAKKDTETPQPAPTTSRMSFFGLGFLRAKTAQTPSVRAVPEEPEPSSVTIAVGESAAHGGHPNGSANGRTGPDSDEAEDVSKDADAGAARGSGKVDREEKILDGEPVIAAPLAT
ncbi:hypothetical protein PENSPDRAFT_732098 [Peniophora sp. CONT]|nr:hypothetical protein PENSPDRAFT_732098 [Peniophora sp. CONT]